MIPALVVAALAASWWLPTSFLFVISLYLVVTLSYSLYLKSKTILDVIVLAGLYTLRVIGGAAAIAVAMSFWLLAFSMFLFLSLAFIKRFAELKGLDENGRTDVAGRGYATSDLDLVRSLGVSAGYGAVVVLALYVNSPEIAVLYSQPKLIWLICPVLLYWLAHTWMMAHRGLMHDDPLVFAIRDRVSQVSVVLAALIVYLAV
jgi:4-hydroxybenzoate polyprenyltransferase